MKKNLKCQYCQNTFSAQSIKAQYCSNTCKTYAYQKRQGKLKQTIDDATTKDIEERSDTDKANAPNLNIVASYLLGLFSKRRITPNDVEHKIKNVTINRKGNFVLASTNPEIIKELKDLFEGCEIFEGATEQATHKVVSTPLAEIFEQEKEEHQVHIKELGELLHSTGIRTTPRPYPVLMYDTEEFYIHDTIYYTVVTLEKVLEVGKLPKEAIE
jgi:hypothetical protein